MLNGKVEIIPNDMGSRITPSYVAFTETERLVGDAAKNQAPMNPKNTIFDAKRKQTQNLDSLIGRRFNDKTVQKDMKLWPFEVIDKNDKPYIKVNYKGEEHTFAAEEISAMVLQKMKNIAESYLGKPVTDAIVTVPAYFDDSQRASTKDAGTIAGLTVLRIINEPTAAALAYGLDKKYKDTNIIVFDLGGGTFDVSLLTLDEGVFEVVATSGDTHLGGEDFDERVMTHFINLFKRKHNIDLRQNDRAIAKLRHECEKAKRSLSSATQVKVEIENLANGIDFSETLTRTRFEELNNDLFRKTIKPLDTVLKDAGFSKSDIHEVKKKIDVLKKKIQQMVKDYFNGKELNRGVNPDEAVAFGAAVQGAIISGDASVPDMIVLDVTPLSLGIETVGGVMTKLIEKNSPIPIKKSQIFSTHQDNQPAVLIQVYQGERAMTADNRLLGTFELTGIPPAPRGVPQIEVTFEVDVNCILNVEAHDKSGGNRQRITITADKGRPSQQEIDDMLESAKKFAGEDKKLRETVDAKNKLESAVYNLKNELSDENKLGERRYYFYFHSKKIFFEFCDIAITKNLLFLNICQACNNVITWLEENTDAELDDYKDQQTTFDSIVQPILKNFYQAHGGSSGAEDTDDYITDHEDLNDEQISIFDCFLVYRSITLICVGFMHCSFFFNQFKFTSQSNHNIFFPNYNF
ncbi:heat shock protein 70 precursor [Reticulomyxa filosa]|uniref:Heat shock protein 70 n=1 Tax=Reticulomyxa filosa TaxID=46433 RepID=X6P8M4_RETFI|nr:heat shock protein 70 precursor [Reticulomyxa filosa]|eukprot:ETO34399.1 heat shock protein 70 precursor [Reticulomyxa filosa]